MFYVLVGILAVIAIVFVVHPMASRRRHLYDLEGMFELGDVRQRRYLESKKAGILGNIKELDFDYEMGKLSDEDYHGLRTGYLAQAQETIEAIERLEIQEEIEELIEGEVRSRRRIQ